MQVWKLVNDYPLTAKTSVMTLCIKLSQDTRVSVSLGARNELVMWISLSHFTRKEDIQHTAFRWKTNSKTFFGIKKLRSPGIHAQWPETPLRELREGQSWSNKSFAFIRGKPNDSLTYNAKLHNRVATSAAIQNIRREVFPCSLYNTDLALSNFWLFVALKISRRFPSHMWWTYSSCYSNIFREQAQRFTATISNILFSEGDLVTNERETMWCKNK